MFNTVLAGKCYDYLSNPINIYYTIKYQMLDAVSIAKSSYANQYVINSNDLDQLGYMGVIEPGSYMYIDAWQGDIEKIDIIRNGYKRFTYTKSPVDIKNIILNELLNVTTNLTYIKTDTRYAFMPSVVTNGTINEVTYFIYYNINSVGALNETIKDYKLIKTINRANETDLIIYFNKSGDYKVACEAVIDNSEVSERTTVLLTVDDGQTDGGTVITITGQQKYLEWE